MREMYEKKPVASKYDVDENNLLPVKIGPRVRTNGGGFDLCGGPWMEL